MADETVGEESSRSRGTILRTNSRCTAGEAIRAALILKLLRGKEEVSAFSRQPRSTGRAFCVLHEDSVFFRAGAAHPTNADRNLASAVMSDQQHKHDADAKPQQQDELKPEINWRTPAIIAAIIGALGIVVVALIKTMPDTRVHLKVKAVEFFNAGLDAQKQGEVGQAIGHYLDALKLDPDHAAAHNNLGIALKAKGDLDGAIEHYNEGLRIDPDLALAHYNLGIALKDKGDLDGAMPLAQLVSKSRLRINPDFI